jgi:hypothetical protein
MWKLVYRCGQDSKPCWGVNEEQQTSHSEDDVRTFMTSIPIPRLRPPGFTIHMSPFKCLVPLPSPTGTVYSQCPPSYWSHAQDIIRVCHPIGHTHGIFSGSAILLVTRTVYSQGLPSYWSHARYILSVCHPIGHTHRIFSVFAILLSTHTQSRRLGFRLHQLCMTLPP